MTGSVLISNVLRFLGLLALQVLIFNQVAWGWGGRDYLFVFVYPLFVAMLPLRIASPPVIFLGFVMGLSVDLFSETLGLHAGALTFAAYCRPVVLRMTEPRDGYGIKGRPTRADNGTGWLLTYLGGVLLCHCAAFFVLQSFSLSFAVDTALKTTFTVPASLLFLTALVLIFNPRA